MPYKDIENRRAASKRHYDKDPKRTKDRTKQRKADIKAYIRLCKTDKTCLDCLLPHPWWRFDHHHRDESTKKFEINRAPRMGVSIKNLDLEMAKCDLICSNCHRDRHHAEARN